MSKLKEAAVNFAVARSNLMAAIKEREEFFNKMEKWGANSAFFGVMFDHTPELKAAFKAQLDPKVAAAQAAFRAADEALTAAAKEAPDVQVAGEAP